MNAAHVASLDFDCPIGLKINEPIPPEIAVPVSVSRNEGMKVAGPPIWREWHRLANLGQFPGDDVEWMARKLPCGECRQHMREALTRCPFRPNDQSAWVVDFHNEINRTLGHPQFKIDNPS